MVEISQGWIIKDMTEVGVGFRRPIIVILLVCVTVSVGRCLARTFAFLRCIQRDIYIKQCNQDNSEPHAATFCFLLGPDPMDAEDPRLLVP